ncbi:reverse transcriptase domain-containing protein, partial [Tanacetum coccineum]
MVTPILLIERVIISTPMKNHMLIDHEYVNCPLRFNDRIRPANLLPIHMLDFDVILGMDWLASHRATIDCYARTVIFGDANNLLGAHNDRLFWALSFKVCLSSALIATISLLIIVVAVAVVVVAVVIVISICRSASTILGQMANLFAVTAPSVGLACVLPLILLLLVL